MKYKSLGNTDLKVSLICLGTMTWGEQNTQEEAFEQMDYSIEQDVNFFDTAELYAVPPKAETYTKTETMIGNWFAARKNRDKIILATKVSGSGLSWIRGGGNQFTPENMTAALEGSLKRLQTDYVDLYQLHWPERTTNFFSKLGYKHNESEGDWTPFETILETAQKFIDQGKIRYLGLSNETSYGLSKYLQLSESKNLPRVVSVQNPYSLVNRTYEVGLAEMSIREQAGLLAYSPLAFGMLSGKYLNNQMPEGSRLQLFGSHFPRYQGTRTQLAVEEYFKVAQKYNLSLAQMSLAFVNAQPFVTSNIIGATSMEQLKENIESINLDLSDEIMEEINIIHENNPSPAP
ncbi:NADP(H)-dependent aldo-keto reductase [Alphaproteobacteria bacterium]|nr:NADP(H)-dependent aldo-keto reductase [Alphaproteobacteria bacterium]